MYLWHAYSKVLKGFYQSDVYVVAKTIEEAAHISTQEFSKGFDPKSNEVLFWVLLTSYPGDEEYEAEKAKLILAFHQEMLTKLEIVPSGVKIERTI